MLEIPRDPGNLGGHMKNVNLEAYTDFIVEKATALLNIDSPSGYTSEAAD